MGQLANPDSPGKWTLCPLAERQSCHDLPRETYSYCSSRIF